VAALVTLLFGMVLQLALALHVRNTLISAAAESARVGALADHDDIAAAERAHAIIDMALGAYPVEVHVRREASEHGPLVTVTIEAPLPVVGLWGPEVLSVEGRSYVETFRD